MWPANAAPDDAHFLSPFYKVESCNILIFLKNEVTVEGLYGRSKKAKTIALNLDHPQEFINAITKRMRLDI